MTGDIFFAAIGDKGKSNGLSWSGSTDGAGIYYQTTTTDQGNLVLNLTDDSNCYLRIAKNGTFMSYFAPDDGSFHGKCYGAVYNDYAEFFPRGEETEPGDIIALDENNKEEKYIKATDDSSIVVGVQSNEYAMLIGGDDTSNMQVDHVKYNLERYIPVGLCGRVYVKCIGNISIGDYIIPSNIPGVGKGSKEYSNRSVGIAIESSNGNNIHKVRILIRKG